MPQQWPMRWRGPNAVSAFWAWPSLRKSKASSPGSILEARFRHQHQSAHTGVNPDDSPSIGKKREFRSWTIEEINKVSEMRQQGIEWASIAESLGRSLRSVVSRHGMYMNGSIKGFRQYLSFSTTDMDRLLSLRETGQPWSETCKSFPNLTMKDLQDRVLKMKNPSRFAIKGTAKPWNADEDALLTSLRCEDNLSISEIAKHMPTRSYTSIVQRVRTLEISLVKRVAFTKEEDEKLWGLRDLKQSWKDIALQLPGRTKGALQARYYQHLRPREQQRSFSTACSSVYEVNSRSSVSQSSPTFNHQPRNPRNFSPSTGCGVTTCRQLHTLTRPRLLQMQRVSNSSSVEHRPPARTGWTEHELAELMEPKRNNHSWPVIAQILGRSVPGFRQRFTAANRGKIDVRSWTTWSQDEKSQLLSMRGNRESWKHIASCFPHRQLVSIMHKYKEISNPKHVSKSSNARWTSEETSQMIHMREHLGLTDREIAANLAGRSTKAVLRHYRSLRSTAVHESRQRRYTPAEDATILAMKRDGAKLTEISQALPGRTCHSVRHRSYELARLQQLPLT